MIKKILAAVVLALVIFTPCAYAQQSEEEQIAAIIAEMPVKPGSTAPEFTLKNAEGQDVSLGTLAGKWVVLDFWGSWCRYCVAGIPAMKEAYSKYHPIGLEIVGIDCNEPEDKWLAALERFELPWINLYNPAPRNEGIGAEYGIKAYPTKILIDPEGKVSAIFLGEDPAFYELLATIFEGNFY